MCVKRKNIYWIDKSVVATFHQYSAKLPELPDIEDVHQDGPPVTVTVTVPAAFAIVPEKSPTTTGLVGA